MTRIWTGSSGRPGIFLAGISAALLAGIGLTLAWPKADRGLTRDMVVHTAMHRISRAFDCHGKPSSPLRVGFLPARFEGAGRPTMVSVTINAPLAVPDLDVRFLLPPGVQMVNGLMVRQVRTASASAVGWPINSTVTRLCPCDKLMFSLIAVPATWMLVS